MFFYCQWNGECKHSTDSERQLPNHLFGAEYNTHSHSFYSWRNLFLVAGWTEYAEYNSKSGHQYNLYSHILIVGMFFHCQRNSERKHSTDSERQLPNHLFGAEYNTHRHTFCCRWNLFLVARWTEYADYNSESGRQYNLYSHILIVGMFFHCQWNSECKHGTDSLC